jgi:hypothetical protein
MQFNALRDVASGAVGVLGGGVGLAGTAAKKFLIADDSSMGKKVGIGALATLFTGGLGLIPYLLAAPGAKTEVQNAKQDIVDNRY